MKTVDEIKAFAKVNHVPIISDNSLNHLLKIVEAQNVFTVLEIGTAIGYSGICILQANKNAFLTTIEKSRQMADIAINNFTNMNLLKRVNLIIGDAKDELAKLVQNNKKFDIIFLDGPKGQYINYLPSIQKLMDKHSLLFTDDIFLGVGLTNKHNTIKNRLAEYAHAIQQPPFVSEIFNIDDGFAITKLV